MRSHKFINSLLYLIILLVAKESRANENNGGIRCFFVLFIDKPYISQDIHFKSPSLLYNRCFHELERSSGLWSIEVPTILAVSVVNVWKVSKFFI